MGTNKIILSKIKRIATCDFVVNPNYEIVLTPESQINVGIFRDKFRPYGDYSIAEVGKGGISHNEDYIKRIGLVIHNNKICYPPELVIYFIDGSKHTFIYETFEEVLAKEKEILDMLKEMGEKIVEI